MARLAQAFARGSPRFTGIRFRLGVAMALALLPTLILSGFQISADFREDALDRRLALELAAERSATTAKARLDGVVVLLEVLRPEGAGPACSPRLRALAARLEGYEAIYRFSQTGQLICSSTLAPASAAAQPWFERLKSGGHVALAQAPPGYGRGPALVAAVRSEQPQGVFDGAVAAVIPLASLRPNLSDRALPADAEVALADADGELLTATDPGAFQLENGQGVASRIVDARADQASVFEADDASGRRRVYAGAAVPGRDIYVLLSAPDPGIWSWARLNPFGNLFLPLLAWAVAFAAVLFVSERIVIRWLDYLERVAAIYAKGRFTVRPVQAENAPTEIRVLARTLDHLGDAITARDQSLTESLAEKDALLREIHHRVKNNLQIISSLLSMQQRALTDPAAKAALGDTRQRISALALIYRTLYQSTDIRHADLKDFLHELVGQLVASESGRGGLVTSAVAADSLLIDPDKLAPLALWLVEAVSNAQKHAFANRGGALNVRLKVQGPITVLEVEDDGPGADPEMVRTGVGSTLMTAFAKQLRGEAELVAASGQGTIARLSFPTPEALTPIDPGDVGGTVAVGGR